MKTEWIKQRKEAMFDQIEDGFSNISSGLKKLHYRFPLETSNITTTFSSAFSTPHHPNLSTPTHYPIPTTKRPIAATVVASLTAKAPTLSTNPTLNLLQRNRVTGRRTTPMCTRWRVISLTIKMRATHYAVTHQMLIWWVCVRRARLNKLWSGFICVEWFHSVWLEGLFSAWANNWPWRNCGLFSLFFFFFFFVTSSCW